MRVFVAIVVTVLTLVGIVSSILFFFVRYRLEPKVFEPTARMRLDPRFESYLAEWTSVLKDPVLEKEFRQPFGRTLDAARYFDVKVSWHKSDGSGRGPLEISRAALDWVQATRADENWSLGAKQIDFSQFDFKWMKDLPNFDHWNLEKSAVVEDFLKSHSVADISSLPRPELRAVTWGYLRYLSVLDKKLSDVELESALNDVRQLVRLLVSSENQVFLSQAIQLLEIETQFIARLKKRGRAVENWQTANPENLTRLKALLRTVNDWFQPFLPAQAVRDVLMAPGLTSTLLCASIQDGFSNLNSGRAPFRRVFPERMKTFDQALIHWNGSCRMSYLNLQWRTRMVGTDEWMRTAAFRLPGVSESSGFQIPMRYVRFWGLLERAAILNQYQESIINPLEAYRH